MLPANILVPGDSCLTSGAHHQNRRRYSGLIPDRPWAPLSHPLFSINSLNRNSAPVLLLGRKPYWCSQTLTSALRLASTTRQLSWYGRLILCECHICAHLPDPWRSGATHFFCIYQSFYNILFTNLVQSSIATSPWCFHTSTVVSSGPTAFTPFISSNDQLHLLVLIFSTSWSTITTPSTRCFLPFSPFISS